MDLQLMSLQNSPLSQVLLSDSNMSPFVYSVYSSLPPTSRQKVSVGPSNSSWAFGGSASFNVPRYGLLSHAVLEASFTVSTAAADSTQNFGNMLIQRATLSSHSREIMALEPMGNLIKITDKDADTFDSLNSIAKNSTISYATGNTVIYVPLNFSVFDNPASYLDTSFIEQLEVNITLQTSNNLFNLANSSTVALVPASCKVNFYYLNMSEADLRSLQNAQYSLEKPLSLLTKSYFRESPLVVIGTGVDKMYSLSLTCPNLISRTIIGIHLSSNGKIGTYVAPSSIVIKSSGRELYSYSDINNNALENALFYNRGNKTNDSNLFVHNWGLTANDSQFGGGVSGKGSSNLLVEITFKGTNNASYTIDCEHEYFSIVSVSSGSGKISNSISL